MCVCTFSKEVKPVSFPGDCFYMKKKLALHFTSFHPEDSLHDEQGGQGHYVKPGPTKPDIMVDAIWDARLCTCATSWFTWWSASVWLTFWFSCFKLLVCTYKGTSSFMTSALDALVFVQVCNLWWVSDKVPQGRGVVSVQLLSRITPDYSNRMSNLHTLISNSSKYLSLGSRFLLAFYSRW